MNGPLAVKRILVGVDFDATSGSAVAVAGELAAAFGAVLVATHAATIDLPPYFTPSQVDALELERTEALARVTVELGAFTARHTRAPVDPRTEEGSPEDVILRQAAAFDLIVLGTHRLRGARRWWLGSVAESVVRRSPVPVLVVPGGPAAAGTVGGGAAVLAPAGAGDLVDRWVSALEQVARMHVTRTESVARCPLDMIRNADLLVVPIPVEGTGRGELDSIGQVLKECARPVLFVPATAAV